MKDINLEDLLYGRSLYEGDKEDLNFKFAKIRLDLALMLAHTVLYSIEVRNKILNAQPTAKGILYLRKVYESLK